MAYKIGIVGCGVIGHRLATAFDKVEEMSIQSVCDLDRSKAEELGDKYNSNVFTSAEQMITNEDLDMVYVGVPPKAHYEIVKLAAGAGCHVICEKPIAENAEIGQKMVDLINDNDLVGAINLPFRYTAGFVEMKNRIDEGEIGKVNRVDLKFRFPRWPRAWQDVEWLKSRDQGGPLREVGTHFFFALLELFNSIDSVVSTVGNPVVDQYERWASGIIQIDEDLYCQLDLLTDRPYPEENTLTIHGEEKSLSLVGWYRLIENYETDEEKVLNEQRLRTTEILVRETIKQIETGDGNIVSFEEALETQKILETIYDSDGRLIEL